ncbi:hypothetical protein E2C01_050906 [Portunus trituberculatus]|uniref:Uncharacterized protein n=1 Tax=Portunus trituberculatus TaxID=210409 RepID=A0A5B7GIS5_PORTR|nr:hypothetical protein [Portunus trituberculatus]
MRKVNAAGQHKLRRRPGYHRRTATPITPPWSPQPPPGRHGPHLHSRKPLLFRKSQKPDSQDNRQ